MSIIPKRKCPNCGEQMTYLEMASFYNLCDDCLDDEQLTRPEADKTK